MDNLTYTVKLDEEQYNQTIGRIKRLERRFHVYKWKIPYRQKGWQYK